MERKLIIATYGDIRGFGAWTSRAAVTPEVKAAFLSMFYDAMETYAIENPDVHFKYLGDGFLIIRVIKTDVQGTLLKHFQTLKKFSKAILSLLKTGYHPIGGFRWRHSMGDCFAIRVFCTSTRKQKLEFVDYVTNMGAHLLEVNPSDYSLATENIVRALGSKRSLFRCRKIEQPSHFPKSVNREDIEGIHTLEL